MACLLAAVPAAQAPAGGARHVAPPPRPDVVLVLVDDATLDDLAALPVVRRRIGAKGTRFTQAVSAHPLCCPARASVLTGQHSHNHGVQANLPPWGGWRRLDASETLAVWLQRAGYATLLVGKYLNGYEVALGEKPRRTVSPGWTEWHVPAAGAYNYRDTTMNHNGSLRTHHRHQTTLWRELAVRLVGRYAPREQPFFLWVSFLAPHAGLPEEPDDPRARTGERAAVPTPYVAPRDRDTFADLRLRAPSFGEADLSDKPFLAARAARMRPRWEYREALQQRRESLRAVDRAVDALLDALAEHGSLRRTLVVFASDNGYLLGEHRLLRKNLGYEESVRVPLLVRGPGFVPGVRRHQPVSLTDLAGTVAQATGATPTLAQDGRPLQPLSQDPDVGADRPMLLQAGPRKDGVRRLYTGIRTHDRRVLLRWRTGDVELYHLDDDPFQLDGGISGSETRAERDDLLERLDALQDCVGDACNG